MIRAWLDRWVAFWDRREAPTSLVLVRVLVAAAVLGDLLVAWQLGLVPELWEAPPFGLGAGATSSSLARCLEFFTGSRSDAQTVWLLTTLSAFSLLIGCFTRLSAVLLALSYAELSRLSPNADRGIDDLLRIACLFLAVSAAGARFSFDAWLRRILGRPQPSLVPAWPRYLLFGQVLWVYFSCALHRGSDWGPLGDFSALARILSDPHYTRLTPGSAPSLYPLMQLGTAATMVFELSAPLMLLWTWYERTPSGPGKLRRAAVLLRVRWLWLGTGVLFHLGIALTMRLGMFPFGMLALYPALLSPREIEEALARLRRRRAGERSAQEASRQAA